MSHYTATVRWNRGDLDFRNDSYSRAHEWVFDGGLTVAASASPQIVPEPLAIAANVDPEEAFVAALSSCHMLFFLALAAERGLVIDSYSDSAEGHMRKDGAGRVSITDVILRPDARYGAEPPGAALRDELHAEAHRRCFIANSVRSRVRVEPVA